MELREREDLQKETEIEQKSGLQKNVGPMNQEDESVKMEVPVNREDKNAKMEILVNSEYEISSHVLQKYEKLLHLLRDMGEAAVAFSSGVDSTFLLKAAHQALGDRVIAVTAHTPMFPARELEEAKEFCRKEGVRQLILELDAMEIEGFAENPPNRCYICKKQIFRGIQETARSHGISQVMEGSNMDDLGDYRPGLAAVQELGIISPLRMAELTKQEIRELSRYLDLPTWRKPSFSCLACRFVYGETITKEKLHMVEQAEQLLMELGFEQMRVRIHGMMARIEVLPGDICRVASEEVRSRIVTEFRKYGFTYVSLDLAGYRSGSMNEVLEQK